MSNSFTRILLCLFMVSATWAQKTSTETPAKESTTVQKKDSVAPKTEKYGLRVGVDLFKLSRGFYDSNYRGLELVGDFRVTRKHYVAVELGNEKKTVQEDNLNFTTNGSYIRAGFDFNGYENWTGMNNQIYIGLRYGFSTFSQTLNSYNIYYPNSYFPTPTYYPNTKFNGLTAHWSEVVVGMKAEVLKNVYMGMSFRMNYMLSQKQPEDFENLYVPGFNRTYGGKFGVGFNYTISYSLPLFSIKVKDAKTLEAEKKAKEEAKFMKEAEKEAKKNAKKKK